MVAGALIASHPEKLSSALCNCNWVNQSYSKVENYNLKGVSACLADKIAALLLISGFKHSVQENTLMDPSLKP